MCGIAGMFCYAGGAMSATFDREALAAMVGALAHRGPDEGGEHVEGPIALGHARLSILDLETGTQPIFSEDRSVAVICNGEIYNYPALRRELEARGHRFATRSDCEVIVHLYEEEGERCVARLRGMFALAVADFRRRRLLLARDRLGKKPLYLADDGRRVAFASELKSFLAAGLLSREIDPEALDLYLTLGYVPSPWTIFRGAAKLPAGHLAVCDGRGLRTERYWDLEFDPEALEGEGIDELTGRLEALLGEAVAVRLASDVPLGAFLSGGIDSGTVVSFMAERLDRPVATHTVGFDDPALDEREDALAVARALGTDHLSTQVHADLADLLPRIAWHFDEPFADPSAVPTWYVSRETRRRVTVALSGDGGDELFAGYVERYRMHLLEDRLRPLVPGALRRSLLPPLARHWPRSPRLPRPLRLAGAFENLALDSDHAYFRDQSLLPPPLEERLFGEPLAARRRRFDPFEAALGPHLARAPQGDPLARALYLDVKTWLTDDILVKVDRMSMAHSLEVRCPLLDHQVAELAGRVPSRFKLAGGRGKLLLRRVAERRLPPAILDRPKRGFVPPVSRWLAGELAGYARDLLLSPGSRARECFDVRTVARLLDDHRARRLEAGMPLWCLLMLECWDRSVAQAPVRLPAGSRKEVTDALTA